MRSSITCRTRDSSAGITTALLSNAYKSCLDYPKGTKDLFLTQSVETDFRDHLACHSLGIGSAADHSPLPSAKLKNLWSCTATLHYCFISCSLIKHRNRLHIFIKLNMGKIKSGNISLSLYPNRPYAPSIFLSECDSYLGI